MCLLQEEKDREAYEIYVAQALWTIGASIHGLVGSEFNMPQYVELIRPDVVKKEQTAQEIKDHVVQRLMEG